jgi:hypothetical protein
MNGNTVAAGIPKKDWLLEKMKECGEWVSFIHHETHNHGRHQKRRAI